MAVRDMATYVEFVQLHNAAVNAATTNTDAVDTRDANMGVTFSMQLSAYGSGDFSFTLEEADDNGSGAPGAFAAVPAAKIIHPNGLNDNNVSETLSAVTADGGTLAKLGVFANKRWVRAVVGGASSPAGTTAVVNVALGKDTLAAGVDDPGSSAN